MGKIYTSSQKKAIYKYVEANRDEYNEAQLRRYHDNKEAVNLRRAWLYKCKKDPFSAECDKLFNIYI